ncbi:hypothetical protein, partial [Xanthomonas albilineans]
SEAQLSGSAFQQIVGTASAKAALFAGGRKIGRKIDAQTGRRRISQLARMEGAVTHPKSDWYSEREDVATSNVAMVPMAICRL